MPLPSSGTPLSSIAVAGGNLASTDGLVGVLGGHGGGADFLFSAAQVAPQILNGIAALAAAAAPAAGDGIPVNQGGTAKLQLLSALQTAFGASGALQLVGYLTSVPNASNSALGKIKLAQDLAGTANLPQVAGWLAQPLDAATMGAPASGNVPSWNGAAWIASTLGVPSGGTGAASLTAYALLAGGTTGAGALQQVSGLGTSGQVLTSNGAAALPTWQAAGGGGGLSNPLGAGTLGAPGLQVGEATTGLVGQIGAHTLSVSANAIEVARFETVASGVNYFDFTPSATGVAVSLATAGADSAVPLILAPKGNAGASFNSTGIFGVGGSTSSFVGLQNSGGQLSFPIADGSGLGSLRGIANIRAGGTLTNESFYLNGGGAGATGTYLALYAGSGVPSVRFTVTANAENAHDAMLSRAAAGVISLDTSTAGNAAGQIKCANATGAGTVLGFGSNCPATTLSGPTTWMKVTTAAGAQGYIPVYV